MKAAALNDIPAWKCIAMATGNTADLYKLNTGKIEVGREADLQVIDNPPGSVGTDALKAIENGDPFGNSMVIVDGRIIAFRGKGFPSHGAVLHGQRREGLRERDHRAPVLPTAGRPALRSVQVTPTASRAPPFAAARSIC